MFLKTLGGNFPVPLSPVAGLVTSSDSKNEDILHFFKRKG